MNNARWMTLIGFVVVLLSPVLSPASTVQLPQTGQEACSNESGAVIPCAGTGQDGDIGGGVVWPAPRFTVNGDCVTDGLTGLVWAKKPMGTIAVPVRTWNWQQALDEVKNLTLCGYGDWRLPNVNELESLVNANEPITTSWLESQGFTDLSWNSTYWTSTPCNTPNATYDVLAWSVTLGDGQVRQEKQIYSLYVLPVRGATTIPSQLGQTGQKRCYRFYTYPLQEIPCPGTGQDGDLQEGAAWPAPRFTVNGECVTDNLTGLMWVKNPDSIDRRWQAALDYANNLTLCGHTDWHLPNRKEMRTLVNYGEANNDTWLTSQGFGNLPPGYYWTSTTWAWNQTDACQVSMDGDVYCAGGFKDLAYSVFKAWPVRDGRRNIFSDVSYGHWANEYIAALSDSGITGGCQGDPPAYCPDANVSRAMMAVFVLTSLSQSPAPTCTGMFDDANADTVGDTFCRFIEKFEELGITGGCGPRVFCPNSPVTRGQMSVFIEAALGHTSSTCGGQFSDVPVGHSFCRFIEHLAADEVTGGCGGGRYCPDDPVTRAQMAVFLVAAPPPLNP